MANKCVVLFVFLLTTTARGQLPNQYYFKAFDEISLMFSDNQFNFQRAVFLTENAYFENQFDKDVFDGAISFYSAISNNIKDSGDIVYYEQDKNTAITQCAVFLCMTDSTPILTNDGVAIHPPFSYNYDDFAGQKEWSSMFVSKLMDTYQGNCHSLPYLYKIIMDELGYESHLALAPNHIYIKANNKKVGWYNIELTCGDFPTDAWYAASGYIHTDAIRNGIYMRALSDKESVAMTLVDLAQGYQAKFGIEDGSFIIKCCDTALEHFPNYINAMLLKAEILTFLYQEAESEPQQRQDLLSKMNELYSTIHKLGYRKMPQEMYLNWMKSLGTEESNQKVKGILNPTRK